MEEELSNLVETSLVAWESDILVTLGKPYFFTATVVRSGRQGLQISRGQGIHNRAGIYTSRGQGIHNSVGIYADAKEYRSQLLQSLSCVLPAARDPVKRFWRNARVVLHQEESPNCSR